MSNTIRSAKAIQTKITSGPYAGFDAASIRVEVMVTTPDMAAHLRRTCHFERQREIKPQNIQRLLSEAKRGTFVAGTPIFICVLPDESMHIVNGNHTLEMVVELAEPVPLTFIYCKVADLNAAGRIYATFDIHKLRTWMDGLRACGVGEDIEMVRYVLPAVGLIMGGFTPYTWATDANSRDLRFKTLKDYENASAVLAAAIKGAPVENQRKVRGSQIFCVALATTRYQPTAGAEFWGGMAHDDALAKNDPRKALLRFISNQQDLGVSSRTDRTRAAILAWNAFFRDENLEYCKPKAVKRIMILGTPITTDEIVQPKQKGKTNQDQGEASDNVVRRTGRDNSSTSLFCG